MEPPCIVSALLKLLSITKPKMDNKIQVFARELVDFAKDAQNCRGLSTFRAAQAFPSPRVVGNRVG